MHEMALAEGVLQIVEDAARREPCNRVQAIWLEIGELSHVDPDSMRFCFDAVARGTIAHDARLEIDRVPGKAWCHRCGREVHVASLVAPCPGCAGYQLRVTGGEEMRVRELEVD